MTLRTIQGLQSLLEGSPKGVFVETGTFHGKTALWAATLFDQVHTIEISEPLHHEVKSGTQGMNIHCWLGDSVTVLPEVLATIAEPAVMYLDAHYFPKPHVGGQGAFPLWGELDAIKGRPYADWVLVDDVHAFGWPQKHQARLPREWKDVTVESIVARLGRVISHQVTGDHLVMRRMAMEGECST